MNANELRLGNWVEANSPMMQVKEITEHTVGLYMPGSEADPFLYDIEEIRPIKLSPEILDKCGFAERYDSGVATNTNHFVLLINGTRFYFRPSYQGGFYWGIVDKDIDNPHEPNDCIPLQSLHQFQNWYFIMAGEELTYKQ